MSSLNHSPTERARVFAGVQLGQAQPIPLPRVMVVGCGSAGVELGLVRNGWVREAVGVDLSPRALARVADAARAEGLSGVTHHQADMNALPIGEKPGSNPAVSMRFSAFRACITAKTSKGSMLGFQPC